MATRLARILYIGDNPDSLLLGKRALEAEGFEQLGAVNALDGLRQVLAEPPDLILMQINLPEVGGYTTTARINSTPELPDCPVFGKLIAGAPARPANWGDD